MKEVNKAAYTCEHSTHQVSEELCALDVDAEHICTLAVSADSVKTASEPAPFEEHEQYCHNQQRDYHAYFYVRRNTYAMLVCGAYSGE